LVFLRAKGEGVYVDTSVGGTGVVLEGLDYIKVAALTLREAILAVELELGSDDGVLAPAMHVKSSLREDKCAGIRDKGALVTASGTKWDFTPLAGASGSRGGSVKSTGHLKESRCSDELIACGATNRCGSTEGMDGVGEGINGVSVIEGLGTKCAVKDAGTIKR
jgi:hypothetical protein